MTEGPSDSYSLLGITPQSSFEDVQAARQSKLEAVGDDPLARSRVEAAYDAVLMDRLKERQQGRVSSAARSASQKETIPSQARPPCPSCRTSPSSPFPGSEVEPANPGDRSPSPWPVAGNGCFL